MNSIFEEYRHFINTPDIDGNNITPIRLMAWALYPKREFICIFCGSPPSELENGVMTCYRCHEYKGIIPNYNQ